MPVNQRVQSAGNLVVEAEVDLAAIAQALEGRKNISSLLDPDHGRERLSLLLDASRRLSRVLNLDQLLNVTMDSVLSLTRAERGFLMLYEGEILKFRVIRNQKSQNWEGDDFQISHTITQQVIDSGQPLWVKDASHDANYSQSASIADLKLRSCMCVPLFSGQADNRKILGVIYVDSQLIHESFSTEDLDLFAALAAQAAISIENAELVENISRLEKEKRQQLERENISLQKLLEDRGELLGQCPAMEKVFSLVRRVAGSEVNLLLLGESGTGKTLVARAIHQLSLRKDKPFMVIDCGSIPENLLESELFGYEKGAFTGAFNRRQGKFELAEGGTVFLDEIGEMPTALQTKLLRVIQEGVVEHVGGNETIKVDLRIIAATSRDLEQDIKNGRFRKDLYYRLNVITIHLPPMREREGDVLLLAGFFLEKYAAKHRKQIVCLSAAAKVALISYAWPGNVRELEHKIERAVIMCDGREVSPVHLELEAPSFETNLAAGLNSAKADIENKMVTQTLSLNKGDVTATAKQLGVARQQIYRIMKRHGIKNKGTKRPAGGHKG
ncbi:sigma 54-interacting transcriptional regulator [candidate division TA06 bacterium]|uniref:Sigma 54-interacting transcriptional regulator n=1 Tax=candidate division TA06 bacterium TaxID=2250710 RepID=A0A933IDJ6_UNCT6|nr:sigma 54-interacting transcriptional regulator [candidate division TA06 bacterium]